MKLFKFLAKAFTGTGTDGKEHDVYYPLGEIDLDSEDSFEVANKIAKESEGFGHIIGIHNGERISYNEDSISLSDYPEEYKSNKT